jgi:hypothetical protein
MGKLAHFVQGQPCIFPRHPALFMIDTRFTASSGLDKEDLEEVNISHAV